MNYKNPFSLLSSHFVLVFLALNIYACSEQAGKSGAVKSKNSQLTETAKAASSKPTANNGTVKTIQNSGGYSYIEVDINGELFWIATAISNIRPGEKITWNGYAMMANFTSKTLNRNFDQIMFVDRVLPMSAMASRQHQGIVIETMDSAEYSYIHVEEKGKKIWLAAPKTSLESGQTISWNSGAPMRNFSSKTMQRTFDEIFFVSEVKI